MEVRERRTSEKRETEPATQVGSSPDLKRLVRLLARQAAAEHVRSRLQDDTGDR